MKLGSDHDWVRYPGGEVECYRCGVRPHWPLAEKTCPIYGAAVKSDDSRGSPNRLTWQEVLNEMARALDLHGGEPLYRCVSPNMLYGRDGRRRTGI